jgi:Bacterial Ig-like domain (group 3)
VSKAFAGVAWATPAAIAYGTKLSSTQLNATAAVPGTAVYSPAAGTAPAAGTDNLSVTFTPTDTTDYATATPTVTLQVSSVTPQITWPAPALIAYGTPLSGTQLNATATALYGGVATTVPGTLIYTPAAGTVLNAGSLQTLAISFTPTDTTDYTAASASVKITVNQAATTTTITSTTPSPYTHKKPLTVYFSVAGSVPAGTPRPAGTMTVRDSTGQNCSGTLSGGAGSWTLTLTAAGSPTLTATYAGNANYKSSTSAAVTQVVR